MDGDSNLGEIVMIDILSIFSLPPLRKESICVSAIFFLALSLFSLFVGVLCLNSSLPQLAWTKRLWLLLLLLCQVGHWSVYYFTSDRSHQVVYVATIVTILAMKHLSSGGQRQNSG